MEQSDGTNKSFYLTLQVSFRNFGFDQSIKQTNKMQEISTDQREESEVNVQGNSNDIEINENIKERLIWSKLDVR